MASSVTAITVSRTIGDCGAVLLAGPVKIVAKDMVEADVVLIYEETTTEGDYQLVPDIEGRSAVLSKSAPSVIFEGYGNYKFVLGADTNESLVVGYAS